MRWKLAVWCGLFLSSCGGDYLVVVRLADDGSNPLACATHLTVKLRDRGGKTVKQRFDDLNALTFVVDDGMHTSGPVKAFLAATDAQQQTVATGESAWVPLEGGQDKDGIREIVVEVVMQTVEPQASACLSSS